MEAVIFVIATAAAADDDDVECDFSKSEISGSKKAIVLPFKSFGFWESGREWDGAQ